VHLTIQFSLQFILTYLAFFRYVYRHSQLVIEKDAELFLKGQMFSDVSHEAVVMPTLDDVTNLLIRDPPTEDD
jgi:hypothetical protein